MRRPYRAPGRTETDRDPLASLKREAKLEAEKDSALLNDRHWRRGWPFWIGSRNPWLFVPLGFAFLTVGVFRLDGPWFYPIWAAALVAMIGTARRLKARSFAKKMNEIMMATDPEQAAQPSESVATPGAAVLAEQAATDDDAIERTPHAFNEVIAERR